MLLYSILAQCFRRQRAQSLAARCGMFLSMAFSIVARLYENIGKKAPLGVEYPTHNVVSSFHQARHASTIGCWFIQPGTSVDLQSHSIREPSLEIRIWSHGPDTSLRHFKISIVCPLLTSRHSVNFVSRNKKDFMYSLPFCYSYLTKRVAL